ncbi:unnamed protein product [Dicrocoelium dendriticum]|nr:unnamed protein product [Dicrocoelium dendriticum]
MKYKRTCYNPLLFGTHLGIYRMRSICGKTLGPGFLPFRVWPFYSLLLFFEFKVSMAQSPAKILQSPLDTKAIAGESVLFFCQAEGNPTPRITFRWNDNELTSNRPGLQIKTVAADSVSLRAKLEIEHNGDTVTCSARNHVGSNSATAQITVYSANETPPKGFPKIIQDPSATISQVGSSAQLHCDVSADPPATVSWIRDQFYPVDMTAPRFRLIGTGSLVIETLLEEDSGSYECMARNLVGTVLSNSGHLHVRTNLTIAYHFLQQQGIQFPPIINEMPEKVYVPPGQSTNLSCRAGGFPVPMVWWSTMGAPAGPRNTRPILLTERPLTIPQPHEGTLRLTDITETHDYYCIAKNSLGLVRRNVSVTVKEYPAAPTELDARPIGSTFAVLRWKASSSPDVDFYTIDLAKKEDKLENVGRRQFTDILHPYMINLSSGEGLHMSYNMTNLSHYTEYVANVYAVSRISGTSAPSKPVEFRTAELAPGSPPQTLRATVVSPNSITVAWRPPTESNGRITGYKVYFTTRPEDPLSSWLVSRTTEERLQLTQLVPNATYYLRASAYNTAGDGPISEQLPVVITPGVPSAPIEFQGESTDPTTIRVRWKTPDVPDGRSLQDYQLRYYALESAMEEPVQSVQTFSLGPESTEYVMQHLHPSTSYHISLAGRTANGIGVRSQIEVTTKDRPFELPAPTGLHLHSLTSDSAKLCWSRPNLPRSTHTTLAYELLFGNSIDTLDPENATAVITLPLSICCCFSLMHLTPGTSYHVWLRLTQQQVGGHNTQVKVTNQAQLAPWITSPSNRFLGPVSELQVFSTLKTVPQMPRGRNVIVRGPSEIQVTWQGPIERLSDIQHYKLAWNCLSCTTLQNGASHSQTGGQRKVLANYGSNPEHLYSATIDDLSPDTSYEVSVTAANLRVVGEPYVFPVVRTPTQTPMKPKNLHLVGIHKRPIPQPASSERLGPHKKTELSYLSVELAWDPPEGLRTSQQITYQVAARLVGPSDHIAELSEQSGFGAGDITGSNNFGEFSGFEDTFLNEKALHHPLLQRRLLANVTGNTFRSSENDDIGYGATYLFEVSLLNDSATGPPTMLNVTTPDAPPSTSPVHLRLSGLSSSAVEMSWAPPPVQSRNGHITGYQVRYFEVGAESQTETMAKVTVPGQRQYIAKDLKEKTYYTFMVRAFTSAGPGPWSGASNIRTSVELPPPPSDIKATRINQHQIKVTWSIPTVEESGGTSPYVSIQGFRLLYSSNDNPYEAGQWTSFDVGPVNMAIISHLESKATYVVCIKSRGQDGRYGDCSQPIISRNVVMGEEPEFSVRNLLCTGEETSVKVTWQQPVRTKQLEGFKLRVGGSKRFADSSGVIRTLEFPARSVSVPYAAIHSGYTYTVSDLEPNSVYDVQLSTYYELTLSMESNWETTSCYTQMQRPAFVPTPIAVATSPARRQVLLQLTRVTERFGKIRHYFLVVAPVHLANGETDKIDIEQVITSSRGLPSSTTRYVAAKYQQDYFNPPPRQTRNFTLGGPVNFRLRVLRSAPEWNITRPKRHDGVDKFSDPVDDEINFDNKILFDGQEYKAFVQACVFQIDHLSPSGPNSCTSSSWSPGFGPDRELVPWNQAHEGQPSAYDELDPQIRGSFNGEARNKGLSGLNIVGNDFFLILLVAVIVGLALVAVVCVAFGCFVKQRRRPKLLGHSAMVDPGMKQPLICMNECGPSNGNKLTIATSGGDLITANMNAQTSSSLLCEQRMGGSSILCPGSAISTQSMPASPPMVPHSSLLSSMTASGQVGLATSGTSSPMTELSHLNHIHHQAHGQMCHVSRQHSHLSGGYCDINSSVHGHRIPAVGPFLANRGGTLGSHSGSHPSSLTGAPSTAFGSNLTNVINFGADDSGTCDGLVIAHSGLSGLDDGQDTRYGLHSLSRVTKGTTIKQPIPIGRLAEHVARLSAADNLLFSQEYESIETDQHFTWENSNMEVNKPKNRYANVIAYDHSRVILQSIESVPGSDYINANYIDGYKKPNAYIATQGPMPETYSDFWRMIWEQRVFIIVMMTRLEERARIKCDLYWPTRGPESYASGLLTVTPTETVELAYYTIRTFNVTARGIDDECREVRQFQFTSWPDHGVPEYPIPLLLFIRRVRAALATSISTTSVHGQPNLIEQGPIVVHCSAGVGRTGAFVVIDIMLERIKYEKTVDIYGCVKAIRSQRNFMVQTEDQYIFIHSALLEAIDAGNTEVPARSLIAHVKKLRLLDSTRGSGMELEYKELQLFRLPNAKYTSAQQASNRNKNRMLNVLPYESTRVTLQPIRGVDGSDYVNANFVDGYRERRAYIATQGPLAKTVEDFWRMVWEYNSTIVVMLTKLVERGRECCHPYWPAERSARYQYYVVDPMVEYDMPNYTLREFKLTDARDGQSRTLRQFQFTDWPEHGIPSSCEVFIEFLGQVHKTKEQFGQDGPITVHCSTGTGRTGVFLALSIVLERMRYEGVVDMFQTVRMLRTQRPGLIDTEEQYQFCYDAALEYLSSFDHYTN